MMKQTLLLAAVAIPLCSCSNEAGETAQDNPIDTATQMPVLKYHQDSVRERMPVIKPDTARVEDMPVKPESTGIAR